MKRNQEPQSTDTVSIASSSRINMPGQTTRPSLVRPSKRCLLVALMAPTLLVLCSWTPTSEAFLNCFTPGMFKMGKTSKTTLYGAGPGGAGPDRANWYAQAALPSYQPPATTYPGYGPTGYAQHPMKMLFKPKWKSGGLFGMRGWGSWRMGAAGMMRPGYGYGYGYSYPMSGYQFGDSLNMMFPAQQLGQSNLLQSAQYSAPLISANDGWSTPAAQTSYSQPIQQTNLATYDGFSPFAPVSSQQIAPKLPLVDPYPTKGGTGSGKLKTVLVADGGYGPTFGAHLVDGALRNHTGTGYAYPEWYTTGNFDSPSRIAQQLVKQGIKRQRQQQQLAALKNRTTPSLAAQLQAQSTAGSKAKFTILDEPRFIGFGSVEVPSNREARLSCSFNEAIDQMHRPLWVKFLGPYNSSQTIDGKIQPPFNCADSQCRTQDIESTKDYRYKLDHGPATSTLIITEPRLADYGTYRCSALTKVINNNPLETIYQIIQFGPTPK